MTTQLINNDNGGTWLTLKAGAINGVAADFMLDHPSRRGKGGGPYRRALVHDGGDGLTVNYNGDYPGGVRINQTRLNLAVTPQTGTAVKLPKNGEIGDILLVELNPPPVPPGSVGVRIGPEYSLWICPGQAALGLAAAWRKIQVDKTAVVGVL